MTTTAAQATITTVGQFLYLVSIDRNGKQRVEFIGGEGGPQLRREAGRLPENGQAR